jgi:dihydroorotate dehydrogenase electron transfer subunit
MNIFNGDALVIRNIPIGQDAPDCRKITLEIPSLLTPQPGQFVHILVEKNSSLLLRRPFSIYDYRCKKISTEIDILFAVVGKGTRILAEKSPDDMVGFLGPLGKGFGINNTAKTILLVAGGVGIAPLYLLSKGYNSMNTSQKLILLFGAKSKAKLYGLRNFKKLGLSINIATEDGSIGKKGLVTELLEEHLRKLDPDTLKNIQLYCCGPDAMIEKIVKMVLDFNLSCEVSLEKRMACGLGACGGCVTKVFDNRNTFRYSRICIEGPVYNTTQLYYEGL